jgi:hypothetical protein
MQVLLLSSFPAEFVSDCCTATPALSACQCLVLPGGPPGPRRPWFTAPQTATPRLSSPGPGLLHPWLLWRGRRLQPGARRRSAADDEAGPQRRRLMHRRRVRVIRRRGRGGARARGAAPQNDGSALHRVPALHAGQVRRQTDRQTSGTQLAHAAHVPRQAGHGGGGTIEWQVAKERDETGGLLAGLDSRV